MGAVTVAVGLVRGRPALVRNARVYSVMLLAGAVVAFGVMEWALLADDFSLVYLAEHSARSTPLVFKVATLWSALEGSILLWGLVLAGYIATVAWRFRHRLEEPAVAWAMVTCFAVALFFFGLMLGPADPFQSVAGTVPTDGPGPNPLLQNHPLMAFHPPVLYLGYVGFTVPFAFAIGSLASGTFGAEWARVTRRWSLAAWGFLDRGDRRRCVVELRGSGLGRLLGVGSGGERLTTAVAHCHRLSAFRTRSGTPWRTSHLERLAGGGHLCPHHPRHVPHPLRSYRFRARLHRVGDRALLPQLPRSGVGGLAGADRLAGRPVPFRCQPRRRRFLARGSSWPTTFC